MALNVGELYTELRMDTSQWSRAMDDSRQGLGQLEAATRQAAEVAQVATNDQVRSYMRLRDAAVQAAVDSEQAHHRATTALGEAEGAERKLAQARAAGNPQAIARAEDAVADARRRQVSAATEATRAIERMETASRQADTAARGIDFDRLEREARRAGAATRGIELPGGLSRAADTAASAIGRIGDRAVSVGSSAGGQLGGGIVEGLSGAIGGIATKAGPIGIALAGVVGLGLGAGAVLAGAIQDGMQRQADMAKVQAGLGVDDDQMRVIGQAASRAYVDGWGESTAENAEVISDAIKSGMLGRGETAQTMQQTVGELQTLATVMDEDVSAAARAAGQAVKTGLVKDSTEAIDLLVRAEQVGLNVAKDMLDTTTEYGTQFRQVGLSGADAFGLMNQAVQNGARDADTAADAIKEFAIKSIDGSEGAAAAYQALGLDAEAMTAKIAKGGEDGREGIRQIFEEMSKLEDPVKRNAVAVGLFGTKAEDLGQAMFAMNLDTAAQQFGQVEGAAKRAGDTIQNTTAAKIEQAQRSIEESMNGVKGSLAEAFGPSLQKVADWVAEHQPEIIGFFGDLASGALTCLDGIAGFTSGALRALATFSDMAAEHIGSVLGNIGFLSDKLGGILKHVPGLQGLGETMQDAGTWMQEWKDRAHEANDKMRGFADTIDQTVRPGLQNMRDSVNENTDAAVNSAAMFRALGDDVQAVPTEHGIEISDNQPEVVARLDALGLKVTTLPNGKTVVTANTEEGQRIIDDFVRVNNGRKITTYTTNQVMDQRVAASGGPGRPLVEGPVRMPNGTYAADGMVRVRANGGIDNLPNQAVIEPPRGRGLFQWAEDETEGEAFIPLARSKRGRSLAILAETARRMGMAVVSAEMARVFQGDPSTLTEASDPTGWRAILGGDYSGRSARFGVEEDNPLVDAALSARRVIVDGDYDGRLSRYGIEEDNPLIAALLGARKLAMTAYADGGISASSVVDFARGLEGNGYVFGGSGSWATDCSGAVSAVANKATGREPFGSRTGTGNMRAFLQERGFVDGIGPAGSLSVGWYNGGPWGGHAAGTLPNGVNFEMGGARGNGQYGGQAAGAGDPMFTDHMFLPPNAFTGGDSGVSINDPKIGELQGALDAARRDEANATSDADRQAARARAADLQYQIDQLKASGGAAQPVFVVNWPGSFGSSSSRSPAASSDSPAAPAESESAEPPEPVDLSSTEGRNRLFNFIRLKYFANGGFGGVGENHEAEIAQAGSWRVWAEPETGGEAYIPLSPAKRKKSLAIWAQTGERLGAFAIGTAMAAGTGWDGDGNFTGFSTDEGRIPGLDKALEELAKKIEPAAAVIIQHVDQINDPVGFIRDAALNALGHQFPILQTNL